MYALRRIGGWTPHLGVALAALAAADYASGQTQRSFAPPLATFELGSPDSPSPNQISISPDGQYVASWIREGDGNVLWMMRPLGFLGGGELQGSFTPRNPSIGFPFWSPDSQRIAFLGSGTLDILDREGGVPRPLVYAPSPLGGTWNEDDIILYAPTNDGPIYRTTADGAIPVPVTRLDPERAERSHGHPFFLPDGRHFIYLSVSLREEHTGIWLASLDSSERTFLVRSVRRAQLAPPDTLFYMQGSTLLAQRLDLSQRTLIEAPLPVVAPVHGYDGNGGASFAVSANGVLVYRIARPGSSPNYGPINVVMNWLAHRTPLSVAPSEREE